MATTRRSFWLGGAWASVAACAAFARGVRAQDQSSSEAASHGWLGDEVSLGSPEAPVTVVQYWSDTCSHCAAFDREVFESLQEGPIAQGAIRYVLREFLTAPTLVSAAGFLLSRWGGREGYVENVRRVFHTQPLLLKLPALPEAIGVISDALSIPAAQVRMCLSDDAALGALNSRIAAAFAAGVTATPTFIFNGVMARPGARLAGNVYEGGEMSRLQFADAVRKAKRRPASPTAGGS